MLWKNTDQLSNLTFLSVLEIPTQLNILDHSKQNESESTSSGIIVPVERNYFLSLSKLCPLLKKLFPTSSNASIAYQTSVQKQCLENMEYIHEIDSLLWFVIIRCFWRLFPKHFDISKIQKQKPIQEARIPHQWIQNGSKIEKNSYR